MYGGVIDVSIKTTSPYCKEA